MSSDRFYRIQNHGDGYSHYGEKVRQYRHELVDEDIEEYHIYGLLRYVGGPLLLHRGFYYVTDGELSDAWWKKPSYPQQLEIKARYPEATF